MELYIGGSGSSSILSKTATEMYALTGTDGQIIYNTTYKNHFRYSNSRWLPLDEPGPMSGFYLFDDFMANTTTMGLNWSVAATVTTATGTATAPGIAVVRQNAASARGSLTLQTNGILLGTMDLYIEAALRVPTLATVGDDFCVAFGLNDAGAYDVNSTAVDGVYFTLNRAVNGTNWILNTASNSVATTTNTSTSVTANTWYRLSILIRAGSTADFYVNGTNVGQHTTNIPTGAGRGTQFQLRLDKSAGVSNSDVQIDYFMTYGFFNGTRF